MLKRLLLVGAASALMTVGAQAADFESPPAVYDWSGFYAGLIAGYSWSDFDVQDDNIIDDAITDFSQTFDVDGALVGVEAGWNHQMDSLVLGLSADIALSSAEDDTLADVGGGDEIYIGETKYFASVRARVGYALDNLLFYATGGLAITEAEFTYENYTDASQTDLTDRASKDKTLLGWTAGGGAELALGETVSLKVEYLYADFGSFDYEFFNGDLEGDVDIDTHMVRGGVLFHF